MSWCILPSFLMFSHLWQEGSGQTIASGQDLRGVVLLFGRFLSGVWLDYNITSRIGMAYLMEISLSS